jgi:large subunit ribosomal protein L31
MRKKIHPKTFDIKVSCVCGNSFECQSTKKEVKIDVCSKCHPFFTGKQKLLDTAGRVDRFKKKYANFNKSN